MRKTIILLIGLLMATPAFAETTMCHVDGPHNCMQSNETELVDLTKQTIAHMQLTQMHPFRNQNDVALENLSRQHAELPMHIQNSTGWHNYTR